MTGRETAKATKVGRNESTAFSVLKLAWGMIAVVFAGAIVWLGSHYLTLRTENQFLRTECRLANVAYQLAKNQLTERSLLAEGMINDLGQKLRRAEDLARLKVTALASPTGNAKEAQAVVVWDHARQAGLLVSETLPALIDTQDYQIWIMDSHCPNPVKAGVFHVGADKKVAFAFAPDQPVTEAVGFGISVEKEGGVTKPESPWVLSSQ